MNKMTLESFANSGRRASVGSQIKNFGGGRVTFGGDGDDPLDLFARTTLISDDDQIRLEKLAAAPGRIGRGVEDLFDSEIGKNDYDWLLTPPETPLYSSAIAREIPLSSNSLSREVPLSSTVLPATARETASGKSGRATGRSVSTTRPSRISTSHTDSSLPARPVRSSSVTRPSISSSYSSSSFSNNNRTSMLNTSSISITSSRSTTPSRTLNRPVSKSTVTARPSSSSTSGRPSLSSTSGRPSLTSAKPSSSSTSARPSTISKPSSTTNISRPSSSSNSSRPSSSSNSSSNVRSSTRPVNSRVQTPTKNRPSASSTSATRSASNSRPSTPNSPKPQTPPNSKLGSRANSRSSTPTRQPASPGGPSALTAASRIPAIIRDTTAKSRNSIGPGSRSSSASPRPRALVRPVVVPDSLTDAPPNLRTQLPARSSSTGRTRLGMALNSRSNSSNDAPAASNKRNYAPPVVITGRFLENSPKDSSTKSHESNGHKLASDNGLRRAKPVSATDSTGFGRNISKTSLDMAVRHMDIRQGMNGLRTSSLFPQSIRSTSTKTQPTRKSNPIVPVSNDEYLHDIHSFNETVSADCRSSIAFSDSGDFAPGSIKSVDRESPTKEDLELDLLDGSMRYDAFILKEEDSNNMNWLHSVEDSSDQSPVFDHRFEPLPEPFDL